MDRRKLPFSDVEISRLGLGCMSMSDAYGTPDEALAEQTLLRALELGVTFFDTANAYGRGRNEQLVGRVLGPHRDKVQIGTKFGYTPGERGLTLDCRPEVVRARCEESLERLGTDYIDLYYAHRVDPNVPVEYTVDVMGALVTSGLVRAIGLCEVNSETLRRAHRIHPISAVQSEYSLWNRDPENGIIETCRELGVMFIPFSPLGRGMLTGTLTEATHFTQGDMRSFLPRFKEGNFEKNLALVARLRQIAWSKNCSPAQLALAWVTSRGNDIVPIPGTKRVAMLEENVAALDVDLDEATLAQLDRMFPIGAAIGERYPEQLAKLQQSDG